MATTAQVSPVKLSHVVLQTNQLSAMRDWYCAVLGAHVQLAAPGMCFLAYDDEHHRIGLMAQAAYGPAEPEAVGLQHFAFTFADLPTLLGKWRELAAAGIEPVRSVNHGPTVSMYYRDPDGNGIELQVDVFDTAAQAQAFLDGPVYRADPSGPTIDPADLLAKLEAGHDPARLMARSS